MRVALQTHGCRLNQAETDSIEAALLAAGHDLADGPEDAEVYVLNSCTITHQADADARRAVRRARRRNPAIRVLVTGCYANADATAVAELEGVDAIVGNADKDRIPRMLAVMQGRPPGSALVSVTKLARRPVVTPLVPARSRARTRALLKVQDGCNYRCAFCIVPAVRGGSRSIEIEDAVTQLRRLVAEGAREVVLTGIHLGTYGRDLRPRRTLVDLVAALLGTLGPARLRLSSLDPHEVSDDLIELFATAAPQLCRHLHLPVQSGDEGILRAMRRGHTAEDFTTLCERLLTRVPQIAIGTDVIVGFPGESDAAFGRTLALLEAPALCYHHVFTYSRREGTAAASMADQIAPKVARERNARLRGLSDRQSAAFARRCAGATFDAIVLRGQRVLTDNYVHLPYHDAALEVGARVQVSAAIQDEVVVAVP